MNRAKAPCGLNRGHRGIHRQTRRPGTPEEQQRWQRKYRLARYGLTEADIDLLLELQDYTCAMCPVTFAPDTPVRVDHDHECPGHPYAEKRACRQCVRGLLCHTCNTALGHIEKRGAAARRYLAAPPGRLLP